MILSLFLCCSAGLLVFTFFIIHHVVGIFVTERYATHFSRVDTQAQSSHNKQIYQHQTSVNSVASIQTVIPNLAMSDDQFKARSSIEETITTQCLRPKSLSMSSSNDDQPLHIEDIADLLHPQYAIITGGRATDTGSPLITFPDNNNFQLLSDRDYQRLIQYLIGVFSLQDADLGFQLIIDRRKSSWASVKAVLFKISVSLISLLYCEKALKMNFISVIFPGSHPMCLCCTTFWISSKSHLRS
jgi:pleckstrin homology domain-containing family G member 4